MDCIILEIGTIFPSRKQLLIFSNIYEVGKYKYEHHLNYIAEQFLSINWVSINWERIKFFNSNGWWWLYFVYIFYMCGTWIQEGFCRSVMLQLVNLKCIIYRNTVHFYSQKMLQVLFLTSLILMLIKRMEADNIK